MTPMMTVWDYMMTTPTYFDPWTDQKAERIVKRHDGYWVYFNRTLTFSPSFEEWCKDNCSHEYEVRWGAIQFKGESDALMCYLAFA